jgi:hypothetical protein
MKRSKVNKVTTLEQRVQQNAELLGSHAIIYGDKAYRIGSAGVLGFIKGIKEGYQQTRR